MQASGGSDDGPRESILRPDAGSRGALVVVLGMHRSGTSAVTELLSANGLTPGPISSLIPPNPFNQHGHFENITLVETNDAILGELGASWSQPPDPETVLTQAHRFKQPVEHAWRAIRADLGTGPAVIKDPRLSVLLPIWRPLLPAPTLFVFCFRDPLTTARSLSARDGLDLDVGMALWETYVSSGLRGLHGAPLLVVDADCLSSSAAARQLLVAEVLNTVGVRGSSAAVDTLDVSLLSAPAAPVELGSELSVPQAALLSTLKHMAGQVGPVNSAAVAPPSSAAVRTLNRHTQQERQNEEHARERDALRNEANRAKESLAVNQQFTRWRDAREAAQQVTIHALEAQIRMLNAAGELGPEPEVD